MGEQRGALAWRRLSEQWPSRSRGADLRETDRAASPITAQGTRFIGPRTVEHLTGSLRALEVSLSDETLRRLDEIWPGPGGAAPEAYVW